MGPLSPCARSATLFRSSSPGRSKAGSESHTAVLCTSGQSKGPNAQTSRCRDANPRERDRKAPRTHLKWPSVDQSQRMQRRHNSENAPGEPKISSTTHMSPPTRSRALALCRCPTSNRRCRGCRQPVGRRRLQRLALFTQANQAARLAADRGGFTVKTGHGARRTTFSATEPSSR